MSFAEDYARMKAEGLDAILPQTERKIRLRSLEAQELLLEGKMPDLLTPLVVKSVFQEVRDEEIRGWLEKGNTDSVQEALAHLETVNFVVARAICDGTKVNDLTLGERRWVFRLVMGPAELLINFCSPEEPDVEPVDEGYEVREPA